MTMESSGQGQSQEPLGGACSCSWELGWESGDSLRVGSSAGCHILTLLPRFSFPLAMTPEPTADTAAHQSSQPLGDLSPSRLAVIKVKGREGAGGGTAGICQALTCAGH